MHQNCTNSYIVFGNLKPSRKRVQKCSELIAPTTITKSTVCSIFDKGYRFGFNGKEIDNEINVNGCDYDFGARIYDSRLGRWLSRDPVINTSWSNYVAFKCTPIAMIDPNGETDYYNIGGNWIGTDGNAQTSDIKKVIKDVDVIKAIKRVSKRGNDFTAEIPNAAFYQLLAQNVVNAILNTFDQSERDVIGDDGTTVVSPGGYHESATAFDNNGAQTAIVNGPTADAQMNCNVILPIESGTVSIHSHPTGTVENKLKNNTASTFAMPSEADNKIFPNFNLNIIVGPETKAEIEQKPVPGAAVGVTTSSQKPRSNVANFFNNLSVKLFSIDVDALRKVNSGGDNKIKAKYERKKAANSTNSTGTNSQ